ncbi:MAG: flagellin [bacterium]
MGVLQINQNIVAFNALRSLKQVSSDIETSVERLSSGLRINRAADDAAGLTISERLRGQVRGLARASQNASEGISFLQTAEGALNETNNILQRIRELAVQSANGILTSNDRLEIQKEVDQLISEIDRIAETSEFNTKKMLNGTAAALISVDDPTRTEVLVNGDVGKGGNFQLRTTVLSGPTLGVLKSDQFNTIAGEDRVGDINGLVTYLNNVVVNTGTSNAGVSEMEVQSTDIYGRLMVSGGSATLSILGTSVAVTGDNLVDSFQAKGITLGTDRLRITGYDAAGTAVNSTLLVTAALTFTEIAAFISAALFTAASQGAVTMAATGRLNISNAAATSIVVSGFAFEDVDLSQSSLTLGFTGFSMPAATNQTSFGTTFLTNASIALTANGTRILGSVGSGINSIGTTATGTLNVRFDSTITAGTTDELTFDRRGQNELSQYGTITQVSAVAGDYVFKISAVTNQTYRVTNLTTGSISNTISVNGAGTAASLNLDTFQGLRLAFDAALEIGETAILHVSTNNVLQAQKSTMLSSISRFQDEGVFIGRNTVELGIAVPGTGRTTRIYVNSTDTIEDLTGKISLAIANPNSNMDLNLETTLVGGQFPDLVHFNLTGPARGTISITSPIPGMDLVFTGDESFLNALSLNQVQASRNATYKVSIVNIHTGALVEEVETSTGIINGVLRGIEIRLDITQGYKIDGDGTLNNIKGPSNAEAISTPTVSLTSNYTGLSFIHIVPNTIKFQIGANQGQDLEVAIGEMSSSAIGVRGLLIVNPDSAQGAITTVDTAIDKVNSLRANLGSVQNRLESTIRNLDISRQNLASAESGIRDLNVAEQSVQFTKEQILLQSGLSVLAQANGLSQSVLMLLR